VFSSKYDKLHLFVFVFLKSFNRSIIGFESLSRLENLETLDLSHNSFNTSTIEPLSALKSLLNLNFAWSFREQFFPAQGILIFCITLSTVK
jgi:hypothetical protein